MDERIAIKIYALVMSYYEFPVDRFMNNTHVHQDWFTSIGTIISSEMYL